MTEAIVIGSGHAGVAAARELARVGQATVMIDVGRSLDHDRMALVHHLRTLDPPDWEVSATRRITQNDTLDDTLPRSLAFGSDHVYERDDAPPLPSTRAHLHAPVPSLARGGRSNVWGAAVLPTHDCDMADWPVSQADLAPHYRRVLSSMPLSGARDGLEAHFPLFRDSVDHLTIPSTAQLVLDRLERSPAAVGEDVAVGRSRLAVVGDHRAARACRYCGHCKSGCVYGAIDTAEHHLEQLEADGSVGYRPGLVARSITETGGRVVVTCRRLDGTEERIEGDRVFVAAGALGSTRILLESLELWDHPVRLASTTGFLSPIVLPAPAATMPAAMTLASFFIEFKVPQSPHWIHGQISPPNELATAKLARLAARYRLPVRASERLAHQLLIAMCTMHSDESGHHVLTLERGADGHHRSHLESVANPTSRALARRAAGRLRRILSTAGVAAIPPVGPLEGPDPLSWHFGSSLPMTERPSTPLETDVLGRPQGFERTHVVDASVLPGIPATTVALVTMANATRIVHDALEGG